MKLCCGNIILFQKSIKLKTYINPLSCCHTCTCCRGCQYSQQLHELTWNKYKSKQAMVMVYLFILRLQVSLASINAPMTLHYFIGLFRINTADQQEGPPDFFSSSEGGVWARDYMRLGWEQDYKQVSSIQKTRPTHALRRTPSTSRIGFSSVHRQSTLLYD